MTISLNGFVAEIATRRETSPEAFDERVRSGSVTDEISSQQRLVEYRRPGLQLGLGYSLLCSGLKHAVVDGQHLAEPRFDAPDIDEALLRL